MCTPWSALCIMWFLGIKCRSSALVECTSLSEPYCQPQDCLSKIKETWNPLLPHTYEKDPRVSDVIPEVHILVSFHFTGGRQSSLPGTSIGNLELGKASHLTQLWDSTAWVQCLHVYACLFVLRPYCALWCLNGISLEFRAGVFLHMVPPQTPQRIISPSSVPTDIFVGQKSFFLFGLYPLLWSADHTSVQHFQDPAAEVALRK